MVLPERFCWAKSGPEAGMDLSEIMREKERQRLAGDGVFLWGIGNSVGPSIQALIETTPEPTVVFTHMRSNPAMRDIDPRGVVRWMAAVGLDGKPFEMHEGAQVTSGLHSPQLPERHWALVCESAVPLDVTPQGWLDDAQLRNLQTGSRVGSRQVTSVVQRVLNGEPRSRYRVLFAAQLVSPYQVTLSNCQRVR